MIYPLRIGLGQAESSRRGRRSYKSLMKGRYNGIPPRPHPGAPMIALHSDPRPHALPLTRRATLLGYVSESGAPDTPSPREVARRWRAAEAVVLPGLLKDGVAAHAADIQAAFELMRAVLASDEPETLFDRGEIQARLLPRFETLAAYRDAADCQEIVKVEFDAMEGDQIIGENLWCKLSWLSLLEHEQSLRFRFSFGMEGFEDVAADWQRQQLAADLCEAIFPESAAVSQHEGLGALMAGALGVERVAYVERIVYFNAPDGGAQFHQDVERGHAGVVYAQMSGATFWLTMPKTVLIEQIGDFLGQPGNEAAMLASMGAAGVETFRRRWSDPVGFKSWFEEEDHAVLDKLLNRTPEFIRMLVERGFASILHPGDVLLLPQASIEHCNWHTVFCLGDVAGEALSFAVRGVEG